MAFKVINKNAMINQKENTVTDTVFYFLTEEELNKYLSVCTHWDGTLKKRDGKERIIEECSVEEMKGICSQEEQPGSLRVPSISITRPINVADGEPYWVKIMELHIDQNEKNWIKQADEESAKIERMCNHG